MDNKKDSLRSATPERSPSKTPLRSQAQSPMLRDCYVSLEAYQGGNSSPGPATRSSPIQKEMSTSASTVGTQTRGATNYGSISIQYSPKRSPADAPTENVFKSPAVPPKKGRGSPSD